MEENSENIIPIEEPKPVIFKNKGGRPPKTKDMRALEARKYNEVSREFWDARLKEMLMDAELEGVSGMKDALTNCQDPQKRSAALLNMRELMEKLEGNKAAQKKKSVAKALSVDGQNWDRKKAIQIASGAQSPSDIAGILQNNEEKA